MATTTLYSTSFSSSAEASAAGDLYLEMRDAELRRARRLRRLDRQEEAYETARLLGDWAAFAYGEASRLSLLSR